MSAERKTLKRVVAPGVWGVLFLDAVIWLGWVHGFEFSEQTAFKTIAARGLTALVVPSAALLLGGVIPAGLKDVFVFWRITHALPGHRALRYATSDPRIDIDKLRRNVSAPFPDGPKEQNAFWYRLFKKVEGDAAVEHQNRHFLLFREIATISLVLSIMAGAGWVLVPNAAASMAPAFFISLAQYLLAALCAAWSGIRLVTTVLAAHSAKRRT